MLSDFANDAFTVRPFRIIMVKLEVAGDAEIGIRVENRESEIQIVVFALCFAL